MNNLYESESTYESLVRLDYTGTKSVEEYLTIQYGTEENKAISMNKGGIAIGYYVSALGENSLSIGSYSRLEGQNSIAFGNNTEVSMKNSVALGYKSTTKYIYFNMECI